MIIKEDEILEDLQIGGLFLIQKKQGFKFGTDAVLLSDIAKTCSSNRTLDLCTGSGIVPVLLSAKTSTPHIDGLEIQPEIADMAKRSVEYNNLHSKVHIECGDLKNPPYAKSSFDVITCNPPYIKNGSAIKNEKDSKIIARHEVACTLDDVLRVSSELLAPQGQFFMVHRPSRLSDIFCIMRAHKIEPKIMRLIAPSAGKAPNLVLIGGRLGGGAELKILPTLFMTDKNGNESKEVQEIYGRGLI
jgi:tRNA1(Val) A37 N6-methylase TrmN6